MGLSLQVTEDGSHTVFSEKFDATYHSTHGAIGESNHVFIQSGLDYIIKQGRTSISILEYGFGTGLNCLLSQQYAQKHSVNIKYVGLELYPIDQAVLGSLNYTNGNAELSKVFKDIHNLPFETIEVLDQYFSLEKRKIDFKNFNCREQFDLIYYDAFGPGTQPDLWDEDMMRIVSQNIKVGGILTTYCAKGSFKRALKSQGFQIEPLPGPPGKREITRAAKL